MRKKIITIFLIICLFVGSTFAAWTTLIPFVLGWAGRWIGTKITGELARNIYYSALVHAGALYLLYDHQEKNKTTGDGMRYVTVDLSKFQGEAKRQYQQDVANGTFTPKQYTQEASTPSEYNFTRSGVKCAAGNNAEWTTWFVTDPTKYLHIRIGNLNQDFFSDSSITLCASGGGNGDYYYPSWYSPPYPIGIHFHGPGVALNDEVNARRYVDENYFPSFTLHPIAETKLKEGLKVATPSSSNTPPASGNNVSVPASDWDEFGTPGEAETYGSGGVGSGGFGGGGEDEKGLTADDIKKGVEDAFGSPDSSFSYEDPAFDTNYDTVEKLSITTMMSNFFSSNPIANAFNGTFGVTVASSLCSFSTSLFGGNVVIDFCSMSDMLSIFGGFLVGIATLYSFFIVWGRA